VSRGVSCGVRQFSDSPTAVRQITQKTVKVKDDNSGLVLLYPLCAKLLSG